VKTATPEGVRQDLPTVPLSQINLSKIGAIAGKGRVQDRDYNNLPVVENLIAHGREAVRLCSIEVARPRQNLQSLSKPRSAQSLSP
jgi:hypothetical protein